MPIQPPEPPPRAQPMPQSKADADGRLPDWLAACAAGDRAAFNQLYQATSGRLYGLCLRILREEGRAQECLQDVFLAVWQQAGRFDPARASAMTWLAAITHHRAISLSRRFTRELTADDWTEFLAHAERPDRVDLPDTDQHAPDHDWHLLDRTRLQECLDALRAEPRTAVQYAFWQGDTYQEIADKLATSLNTVKSWVRRALAELKTCIGRGVMPS
ncbi:MAG: hypothetical protein B7X12_08270 [Halothiobacillus sp. 20-53-49]|nr:MAG: hypothetical protein B7X12_08270 [Halothiobacillus sp. 20-53-49]